MKLREKFCKRGSSSSLWYALCKSKWRYVKIVKYSLLLQKKIERRKKLYKTVTDNQRVLKIWKTRNLTLEGKILNFEIIVISKVVFQSFITSVLKHCERTWKNTKSFFLEKLYS